MVAFFIILAIIVVVVIISVKAHSSYESKVDEVRKSFLSEVSNFSSLTNLCFEVRTDGKKIKTWDRQHKIDFIINNNKDQVIRSLILYNELVLWWSKNGDAVISRALQKGNSIALGMYFLGGSFRTRTEREIHSLVVDYNPTGMKFLLRTFTIHSNTRHYNPNTREWWYDDSPEQSTFSVNLTPNEILERVEVLAQYNFEMTEYQYNVDNQRKLMTRELRQQIIERDNMVCQICKKKCRLDEIEIDHIKPVSKGGKTTISNLQVLCSSCNRQKSNKWLEDISTITQMTKIRKVEVDDRHGDKFNKKKNLKPNVNCVQVGDSVKIRYIEDDEEITLKLVEDGANIESNTFSIGAPICEAILGRVKGDSIDVRTPKGIDKIEIVEIYKRKQKP